MHHMSLLHIYCAFLYFCHFLLPLCKVCKCWFSIKYFSGIQSLLFLIVSTKHGIWDSTLAIGDPVTPSFIELTPEASVSIIIPKEGKSRNIRGISKKGENFIGIIELIFVGRRGKRNIVKFLFKQIAKNPRHPKKERNGLHRKPKVYAFNWKSPRSIWR